MAYEKKKIDEIILLIREKDKQIGNLSWYLNLTNKNKIQFYEVYEQLLKENEDNDNVSKEFGTLLNADDEEFDELYRLLKGNLIVIIDKIKRSIDNIKKSINESLKLINILKEILIKFKKIKNHV